MGHHTFDSDRAAQLEEAGRRYRYLSRDELLGALAPDGDEVVADLGSGTGFYTDDIAPHVGGVHAVDIQEQMHEFYREKGVPENVSLVTSGIADLPFEPGALDAAVSTMTYHEFASDEALAELTRVLADGGRFVVADWRAGGNGEAGPPLDERYSATAAADALAAAGFERRREETRPETFLLVVQAR
ncbi:probable S-adenosylmethionine-dependent methyltransferase [Natronomonas pharaonis DSM 2160]|uniref:Probable S-adenosylmethionine-dependent methyltransferase n=1 Tax=Natronomonas pharaonis (strain ATCC 35678 / DSM 2160 / CIP 103997 / JCM 8858 / NBRC 14720 / NCIMB 2260 / Gabara) TaxID=348780 RepID=A0A1U7EY47_NATPD|nr:class I SAM-dependent methyltransferase [Natronomonas pharaonis]CAI50152.2 probable S-adenosylmethionine-dependent methyltransferase [Natronomonas pharaonis DSM 2160]